MTIKKYNGSTWDNATIRKMGTATEIITPPTTIYADGSNITTYTIKGNTIQNGTPTPSAPVDVVGVGELDSGQYKIPILSANTTTSIYLGEVETTRRIKKLVLTGDNSETYIYDSQYSRFVMVVSDAYSVGTRKTQCYCSHYNCVYHEESIDDVPDNSIYINYQVAGTQFCIKTTSYTTIEDFKIYLQQQYANGTPVTIWYVLATEETGIVNEPLRKIGDYADMLSNATSIPTTEGANSITVDTTVQPSEFTATWTGWHDATVKEFDGSQWN